jgi:hypothetical protein
MTGLLNKIFFSIENIDLGRKGLITNGKEHEGHIAYELGIAGAMEAFEEAQTTADPKTLVLAEYTFLEQEFAFCHEADTDTRSSLSQAIQNFNDALLSLEAVEDAVMYQGAEKTHPHSPKYRIQGYPKDAFHLACIAHRTRIRNSLRTPGINMIEKALLNQRSANMTTAQNGYIEKQKKVLPRKQV